jgi:hypothetical protein
MNYSKGITWFDDCRIPFVDEVRTIPVHSEDKKDDTTLFGLHPTIQRKRIETTEGRFPANLLCSDDVLNDGLKTNKGHHPKSKVTGYGEFGNGKSEYFGKGEYSSVDSKSRYYDIDKWFEKMLNEL